MNRNYSFPQKNGLYATTKVKHTAHECHYSVLSKSVFNSSLRPAN